LAAGGLKNLKLSPKLLERVAQTGGNKSTSELFAYLIIDSAAQKEDRGKGLKEWEWNLVLV